MKKILNMASVECRRISSCIAQHNHFNLRYNINIKQTQKITVLPLGGHKTLDSQNRQITPFKQS